MAGELIGALRVTLGLDTATFEAGAKKAEDRAYQLGERIGQNLRKSVGGAFGQVAASLGAALSLGALTAVAAKALDYASSLGEVSQQLGVTTKDLQTYRYMASQVGISQEEMDKGLQKLTLSIGQAAAGSEKQVTAFRALGVSVTDANGNLLTAGQIMPRIADGLAKIEDPAKRAAIEVELFGKTGQKLETLLAGGSGQIDELRKAAEDLGLVLSEDQIANADRTADKLSEVKQVLEARIAGVVADNAGAIYSLAQAFETLITGISGVVTWYQRFKAVQAIRLNQNIENGWFTSSDARAQAAARRDTAERQLMVLDHPAGLNSNMVWDAKSGRLVGPSSAQAPSMGALPSLAARSARAASSGRASTPRDTLSSDVESLLNKLLPLHAAQAKAAEEQATLNKALAAGKISASDYALATETVAANLKETMVGEKEGIQVVKDYGDAIIVTTDYMGQLEKGTDKAVDAIADLHAPVDELARRINDDLSSSVSGLITGFSTLGDVATSVLNSIAESILGSLFKSVSGDGTGGLGGAIASGIGSLISGHRAGGGPVSSGKSYLVGEMGPEIFTPSASGHIVANDDIRSGGMTFVQNISPNFAGSAVDREELARWHPVWKADVIQAIRDMNRRAG